MIAERTQHARLSPSSAHRWVHCPGSVRLEDGFPDTSGEAAREGTAAHEIAERALRKGVDASTWVGTMVGVPYVDGDGEDAIQQIEVTTEMAEAVQEFVDHVRDTSPDYPTDLYLERRVSLAPLDPPEGLDGGTADAVRWDPKTRTLRVMDYKHGRGVVVEVEGNLQLRTYALMTVVTLRVKPKRIIMTVVQPRAPHTDGPVRTVEMSWDELVKFKRVLFAAAEATHDPDAPLNVGDWCRFCKAQAVCPAQMAYAEETAKSEFSALPALTDEADPGLPSPAALSIEGLAYILDRAGYVEAWLKSVRQHVQDTLERGEEVPGYKLVPKRAQRRWKDEEAVEGVLRPVLEDGMYTRKIISPAQAEKAFKAVGEELDSGLWEKVSSGNKLAPSDDPRPGQIPSAQSDFEAEPPTSE